MPSLKNLRTVAHGRIAGVFNNKPQGGQPNKAPGALATKIFNRLNHPEFSAAA